MLNALENSLGLSENKRRCSKCDEVKSLDEFYFVKGGTYKGKRHKSHYEYRCKECKKAMNRKGELEVSHGG